MTRRREPAPTPDLMANLLATLRKRNATRLRAIVVRQPDEAEGDSSNSGGVVVEFGLGAQTSTSLDMNRREAQDLLDRLAKFLHGDTLEGLLDEARREEPPFSYPFEM